MKKYLFFGIVIVVLLSSAALAENFKVKALPNGKVKYVEGEILVKYKEDVSMQEITNLNIAIGTAVLSHHRKRVKRLRVPAGKTEHEVISILKRDPRVEYAELNTICHAFMIPNDPFYDSYQWHFPLINCPWAWDISTGSGIVVGILDTGIGYEDYAVPSHELSTVQPGTTYVQAPDLDGTSFAAGYDFINNDSHPNDNNGHGTHVAGTVAQTTNNSDGAAGMAFDCILMPVKVLDYTGSGTALSLASGLYWATDNGANVINMSLGWIAGYNPGFTVQNAIKYAYDKEVVLVASSGNEGVGTVSYPAAYSEVIAVGASRYDDKLTYYSQYGSAQELVAPGGDLYVDQNGDGYGDGVLQQSFDPYDPGPPEVLADPTNFSWWFYTGTSQAAPHVSALVAMMIANGQTGVENIRTILHDTAVDLGASGWDQSYGYGRIDAYAALTYAGAPPEEYATPPYSTGFESGDLDQYWTTATTGNGRVRVLSSNTPHSDFYHLCMDDSTRGGYSQTEAWLHVNLAGNSEVNLEFWWKDFSDETHSLDGVYFSDDGGANFTKVQDLNGGSYTNNTWYNFSLDLDELATSTGLNLTDTFVIKFQQYDNYPMTTDGFAFDDISVTASGPECQTNADCNDGLFCNGAETCVSGFCQGGADPCPGQLCDEGSDRCVDCLVDGDCDDGLYCNGAETCVGGTCQDGTAVNCDDGIDCTTDSCNENADSCDNIPDDGFCDDGLFCNGVEICDAGLGCQAGSDPCSGQYCDEVNDSCHQCGNDLGCDDGLFCNGAETCVGGACQSGTDPCESGQYCNDDTDTCENVECLTHNDCDDGNDCTFDTCVDGVCYNECTSTVTLYPYTEGFESGQGDWVNDSGDDIDWTRNSGSTPSSSTGPSSAHSGSYYIYTEASSPNYPDKTAVLASSCFDLSNTMNVELTFWYHMYGSGMGSLNVEVSEDCAFWTGLWSLSGDQGNRWHEAKVDLTPYSGKTITIRFRGVTGSSYRSDMAIDDLEVTVTPALPCSNDDDCNDRLFCNGVETCVVQLCQPGSDPCPGEGCDEVDDVCVAGPAFEDAFESGNAQGWDLYGSGSTAWTGDWEIGNPNGTTSGGDQAQPEDAYEGAGCAFTARNSSLGSNDVDGGVVYLVSPVMDLRGASSAELRYVRWFYNRDTGEDSGDFFVAEVSDDNGTSWVNLETLDSNQSANSWTEQSFVLEDYISLTSTVQVRFGAADGSSRGNIIEAAIDNVVIWAYGDGL